jgi:small subunit ribosomal protein S7
MAPGRREGRQLKQRKSEMPRRREVPKRDILPDPKFGIVDLVQVHERHHGSRQEGVAERIIYGALDQVEKKSGKDPLEIFIVA